MGGEGRRSHQENNTEIQRERQEEKTQRGNTQRKQRPEEITERENDTERVTEKRKRFMGKGSNVFHGKVISFQVSFPCTVLCHMWEVRSG